MSAGAGERFLMCVNDDERHRYEAERDKWQQELTTLRATPESPQRNQQIKDLEARVPAEPKIMALWIAVNRRQPISIVAAIIRTRAHWYSRACPRY